MLAGRINTQFGVLDVEKNMIDDVVYFTANGTSIYFIDNRTHFSIKETQVSEEHHNRSVASELFAYICDFEGIVVTKHIECDATTETLWESLKKSGRLQVSRLFVITQEIVDLRHQTHSLDGSSLSEDNTIEVVYGSLEKYRTRKPHNGILWPIQDLRFQIGGFLQPWNKFSDGLV